MFTLMVYMVGSDLESKYEAASADLQEMLNAQFGTNVQIVLQTGGCSDWTSDQMKGTQRWVMKDGSMQLWQDMGDIPMLSADSLTSFITDTAAEYEGDQYGLIFWDHGGGSLYGFGYDETNPNTSMSLEAMSAALDNAKTEFAFIGFDACLMNTLEVATALEPHADYLIASETTEPGSGWYYTDWLNSLESTGSFDAQTLGKEIVDDFITVNGEENTLAVTDLKKIQKVSDEWSALLSQAGGEINSDHYAAISTARQQAKTLISGEDMIDMMDFAQKSGLSQETNLSKAMQDAVVYQNECTDTGLNGMSVYFPYSALSEYQSANQIFTDVGIDNGVLNFYDEFVNVMSENQDSNASSDSLNTVIEQSNYLPIQWSDEAEDYIYPMTNDDWYNTTEVDMQIMVDDGEGYIDLGQDQYYEIDDEGNLLMNFDNTWVAINGEIVPYYASQTIENSDESITYTGVVPAVLNEEQDIDLVLQWDETEEDSNGYIVGYCSIAENGTVSRIQDLKAGDQIQYLCDYYSYDGDFEDSYYYGDPLEITGQMPTVSYESLEDLEVLMSYQLIDIYQNYSWTESVSLF